MQAAVAVDEKLDTRRWWALAVLCVSLLTITLDNTILNVALPSLVQDLHASTSQLQWIVDGYTLVFAGLLLTSGSLGDRFGRKGALGTGLLIFGVGSAFSAFATSATQLIFTRAGMGIGAAMIMPSTLSLLTNIFRDPKERGRAIGVWAAVAGGAGSIGPVLGGFLLRHFWWGSVFLINVPVAIIAFTAGRFLLPKSRDPSAPKIDLFGALLSIAGLVALLWAIIEAPTKGWSDGSVIVGFLAGAAILAGFMYWELHSSDPMLDVRFFKNRRFSAANAAITMVFFGMFGSMFLITQYLQTVLGFSPLEAGVRLLPMAAGMLIIAPTAPRVVEKIGTKLVVGGGLLMAALGLYLVSTVPVTNGYTHLVLAMCIMSAGMGFVMAPATESIMGSLPREKAGVGSAMNDTTRQVGGALGVAILGSVLASFYRPGVTKGLERLHVTAGTIDTARESVGGAVAAAQALPGDVGRAVATTAKVEFVNAFGSAILAAAIIVAVAALIVFAFLPARAHDAREDVATATDGVASLTFAEAEGALEAAEADAQAEVDQETDDHAELERELREPVGRLADVAPSGANDSRAGS
jgi:EmrB/QacA subfamily drug resistance transporter